VGPWFVFLLWGLQSPHAHVGGALDLAKRPVTLRTGIGTAHDAVGTTSRQAQAFYDQGLACLHAYTWLDAARSFNQALTIDPRLAVAHAMLSIAYTELNAPAAAREALQRASTLAAGSSAHDRTHVEARALQAAAEASHAKDALDAYRKALDAAVAAFPGDEEFWLQRGLAESPDPGERGQGSVEASIAYYRKAAALAPNHFAAHHYLTHAYENLGRTGDALAEANAFTRMAAGVPHARHMRGHALRRSGQIDAAIAEFAAADALERAHFTREHMPADADWHYQHNLDLLGTSYQYAGQMAKAEPLLRQSFTISSPLVAQEVNKREWPAFLLARGRMQEALDAAAAMASHRSPLVSAAGHIAAGEVRLAMRDSRAAADEANQALRLMRGAEGAGLLANSLQALQGEYLLRIGQREKARPMLEDVAKKIRAAPGPDAWTAAVFALERIARFARDAGEWDVAAWAAQQMIDHDPNYAGGHYAAGLVAAHRGDRDKARQAFALAAARWTRADQNLPELLAIRSKLR
jgi:tetratricopeptide (TPR) repeat protein